MHTMNVTGFVFTIQPLQTGILRQGDTIGSWQPLGNSLAMTGLGQE